MSDKRQLWKCLIRRNRGADHDPQFHQKVAQHLRELGISMKLSGIEIVKVRRWKHEASEIIFAGGTEFPSAEVIAEKLRTEVPLLLAGEDAFSGALPL
jgi:hypothetical protein